MVKVGFLSCLWLVLAVFGTSCGGAGTRQGGSDGGGISCSDPQADYPSGETGAPALIFYFEQGGVATTLSAANASSFLSNVQNLGCGPFGVWEAGTYPTGEVGTEIEMRKSTREKVYAMASGVVVAIQESTAPMETGEVEGVWVRYGANYVIKYVHVKSPIVELGDRVAPGDVIGDTVAMSNGSMYFYEVEVRRKDGDTLYALPWNTLLSGDNKTAFDGLFGNGNCAAPSVIGIDGQATTVSNWKNDAVTEIDVTSMDQPCSF